MLVSDDCSQILVVGIYKEENKKLSVCMTIDDEIKRPPV
jgi:hypothetical protein